MTDIEIKLKYGEMFDYDYYPNEPTGTLSVEEITALYKKCINEGKPWQAFVKVNEKPNAIL